MAIFLLICSLLQALPRYFCCFMFFWYFWHSPKRLTATALENRPFDPQHPKKERLVFQAIDLQWRSVSCREGVNKFDQNDDKGAMFVTQQSYQVEKQTTSRPSKNTLQLLVVLLSNLLKNISVNKVVNLCKLGWAILKHQKIHLEVPAVATL